jgi:MFS family permease
MTREAKETIRYYLLLRTASAFGISFIAATYVTYLISNGLNLFEVNLVNLTFFTTLFVCEIPTGAFADVFGRKLSFVISCLLFSVGMFLYGLVKSFWGFALAEAIAAVGSTFASGAFQAWLIDRLRHQGYEEPLGGIFAKEQQIRNGMGIIAAIIGAFFADKNMSLPWFVGGCVMALAGGLAIICMKEEAEFMKQKFSFTNGVKSMVETIRVSTQYGLTNKAVRFVLITGAVQFFAVQAPNMQWQPFFGQFLPNKTSYGFLFAGMSIAMMIGSAIAPWFLKKMKNEKMAISLSQIAIGAGIFLTVFFHQLIPAISIFLMHEVARGLFMPLKDVYLNDNIPSKERATLISFDSISHHIGGMSGLLISGAVAQYLSLPSAWIISGLILAFSALLLLRNGDRA